MKEESKLTMSTKSVTKNDMGSKKQSTKDSKRPQGRPKVLSPELDSRFQIRCSTSDIEAWEGRAEALGYGGASAWIRHVINQAIKQPVK